MRVNGDSKWRISVFVGERTCVCVCALYTRARVPIYYLPTRRTVGGDTSRRAVGGH